MTFPALLRLSLLGLTALAAAAQTETAPATEPTPEQVAAMEAAFENMSFAERLQAAGVNMVVGPTTAQLGDIASIELPEGYYFVGGDALKQFYELTQNMMGGNEVGVVLSPDDWTLFFDFDDIGYVKDDEKDELNADDLMESMTEGQESANSTRRDRGWDEMRLRGWVQQPHYDEKTNNLKWAFNLSSSSDNFESVWINQSIRLLGRTGVMNVTLVGNPENFSMEEASADALLANNFSYLPGERYAEFKEGDKIAEYGLAALVLGGAGAFAAKTGFLAKFWKFIVIGFVALGGFFKKLWNRITGSRPAEATEEEEK